MAKGGGGSTSTKFNAGSIPQSLYNLGGAMNYFRQNDLEPLQSSPVSLINWALGQSGVPTSAQQTTGPGGYIQGQTYAPSGGQLPAGGQGVSSGPPTNPWAGKTAGNYGDPTAWYNWISQNAGNYVYINGQPVQIQNTQASMQQISQAQASGTLQTSSGGGDPYLQAAQNIWSQLTGTGQNLISGGQSELQQGITDLNQVPGYSTILGAGTPFFDQANQMFGQAGAEYGQAAPMFNQAQSMFNTAAPLVQGNLTPEQQAYINQATQAQQAGITQQLANEGLVSSTMLQEKLGGAAQQGAATAGQLIQGNIGLGINEQQQAIAEQGVAQNQIGLSQQQQQLGIGEQGQGISMINAANNAAVTQLNRGQTEASLGLNMQTTGANYLQAVSTANLQTQQQFYNEAMSGYGVLGQMLSDQLQMYGYQLSGEQIKVGASTSANQISAQVQEQQQQAQAQGFSGLLSGLGSLLGGKSGIGGGIGSLIGGGSSLIAGAGGTAVGGAAAGAAGGASAAGLGSAVGSALTALSAAFCQAGREIFGAMNPEWMLLRDLMLFHAPKWVRRFYIRHAHQIAGFLHKKEITKKIVRTILRVIMD